MVWQRLRKYTHIYAKRLLAYPITMDATRLPVLLTKDQWSRALYLAWQFIHKSTAWSAQWSCSRGIVLSRSGYKALISPSVFCIHASRHWKRVLSIKPCLVKMLRSILLAVFYHFTSILIALLELFQREAFCTTFSLKHFKILKLRFDILLCLISSALLGKHTFNFHCFYLFFSA